MSMHGSWTTIEEPASPYTVIAFGPGDGLVVTHSTAMSIDAAAVLLITRLEAIDWRTTQTLLAAVPQPSFGQHPSDVEAMLDVAALVAEVNLYAARALWRAHVPPGVGIPRMLADADEHTELRFQENLAEQRTLTEGGLVEHLMMSGDFMSQWAQARRHFVGVRPSPD